MAARTALDMRPRACAERPAGSGERAVRRAGRAVRLKRRRALDDMTTMADAPSTPVSGTLPDDRFRALVEDLPAISYIADFTGAFTLRYVSPQIESVLGFTPEDWLADDEAWVLALHPEDRERIVAEAEACIAAEQPFDFEYRMIDRGGRIVWIWEKTSIQVDAEGRPHAVNGVMLDVTELRRTQEALLHEADRRASERARFEAALKRQADEHRHHALHDELTGLPNRRSLYERLNEKMETTRPADGFALLLVDLDRFKEVNDVLGHQSGDELLCQVAGRFGREVREQDLLARLGGDEFAVLVSGRNGAEAGLEIARRLSDALDREFILSGVPVHVEASIGIARFPHDGRDATALLRCADSAMYAAKDLSTELELFDGDRDHHSPTRLKRLGELRQALTRGELVLHYQPKLRLGTGSVVGVEALVRWLHPDQGLLPPGEFVPLAEQTGLIKPLTSFVLRESLEQLAAWHRAGHDLTIAVNVSERSLLDPEFPAEVARVLRAHRHPGGAARARDHRGDDHGRPGARRRRAAAPGRARRLAVPRRLRDGLLVTEPPARAADRRDQDRSLVRRAHRGRRARRGDHALHHRAGPQPRLLGRRRGPGDRRGAGLRRRPGLRHRAGLPHRPPARRRLTHRVADGARRGLSRAAAPI